jgi:hypothetical protein
MTAETAAQEELLRAVLEEQKNAAAAVRNLSPSHLTPALSAIRAAGSRLRAAGECLFLVFFCIFGVVCGETFGRSRTRYGFSG